MFLGLQFILESRGYSRERLKLIHIVIHDSERQNMKKLMKVAAICMLLLASGCINCYLRCPVTDQKIDEVYKSTKAGAGMSYVVMFP